jgi:hypothetical protein
VSGGRGTELAWRTFIQFAIAVAVIIGLAICASFATWLWRWAT